MHNDQYIPQRRTLRYLFAFFMLLFFNTSNAQINPSNNDTITSTGNHHINQNPNYSIDLATKLGADDYGMKSYFFVILKTGTNTSTDSELISESFNGHMKNIQKLVDEEKLIIAGPFGKNETGYRGIFILHNVNSEDDIKLILQNDPAIKNGFLDFEIYNWYGSAALPEYLPASEKIWKLKP